MNTRTMPLRGLIRDFDAEPQRRPTAVRGVARANGDNRIAILLPCHWVVGSDGKLTGCGGGLWRKQRLLVIEQEE